MRCSVNCGSATSNIARGRTIQLRLPKKLISTIELYMRISCLQISSCDVKALQDGVCSLRRIYLRGRYSSQVKLSSASTSTNYRFKTTMMNQKASMTESEKSLWSG